MDFKFNFSVGEDYIQNEDQNIVESGENANGKVSEITSEESIIENIFKVSDIANFWTTKSQSNLFEIESLKLDCDDMILRVVTPCDKATSQQNLCEGTDLIPNVYEGGFKVWECTIDLLSYLSCSSSICLKDKRVLDLGCGVGILGTYALCKYHAEFVTFQDFNRNVILNATGPTLLLNMAMWTVDTEIKSLQKLKQNQLDVVDSSTTLPYENENLELILEELWEDKSFLSRQERKVDFITGDWCKLTNSFDPIEKYDVILSSETIYNPLSYSKLHVFLEKFLKSDGEVVIASKSHYFGVGGGVLTWMEYVNSQGIFDIKLDHNTKENLQRTVLCMKFKASDKT